MGGESSESATSIALKKRYIIEDDDSDEDMPLSSLSTSMATATESKPSIPIQVDEKVVIDSESMKRSIPVSPKRTKTSASSEEKSSVAASTKSFIVSVEKKPIKKMVLDDDDDDDDDIPLTALTKKAKTEETFKQIKKEVKTEKNDFVKKEVKKVEEVKVTKNVQQLKKDKVKVKKEPSSVQGSPAKKVKPESDEKEKDEEDEEEEEYRWWEDYDGLNEDKTIKWTTLEHSGVYFPPEYVPHGVKLIYDGKEIDLEPAAEEVAGFYAAMIETDYAKSDVFNKNFFDDFQAVLRETKSKHRDLIKDFKKCDFSLMAEHFEKLKLERKAMTKDQKLEIKNKKLEIDNSYGFCYLNGFKQKVGNFRVEPPGLFRGRGKHPKAGCLKKRIRPEDVTINISEGAKVPVPPAGHKWAEVIHNNQVTWLASWMDSINNTPKYVFLAANSSLKGISDLKKFEKARDLSLHIDKIRRDMDANLRVDDKLKKQLATALYFIDKLALRAGNEKGEDEADTVGCCSLRVEHISLEPEDRSIIFDFLGKDSIRYYNQVKVPKIIFKNVKKFMKHKQPDAQLFDRIDTGSLNEHLSKLMPGLTAKVFRTFNASYTFEQELKSTPADAPVAEKILSYNRANRQVAILCNHQRSVPKTHEDSMKRLQEKILMAKFDRYLLRQDILSQLSKSEVKKKHPEMLEDESDLDEPTRARKRQEKIDLAKGREAKRLEKKKQEEAEEKANHAKKQQKKPKDDDDDENDNDDDNEEEDVDNNPDESKYDPCVNRRIQPVDKLLVRIEKIDHQIQNLKTNAIDRDEGKTTALGTSKINYIDPRISSAWCNRYQVPIDKIFNRTLRDKFKWAMDMDSKWRFDKRLPTELNGDDNGNGNRNQDEDDQDENDED